MRSTDFKDLEKTPGKVTETARWWWVMQRTLQVCCRCDPTPVRSVAVAVFMHILVSGTRYCRKSDKSARLRQSGLPDVRRSRRLAGLSRFGETNWAGSALDDEFISYSGTRIASG
ncbi:hypothetical protein SAMN06272759_102127 [Novosphingobium sp. B1]|nr:hypothetical protein SAMN06272759_102127 [Novosphingobium sp. B1]